MSFCVGFHPEALRCYSLCMVILVHQLPNTVVEHTTIKSADPAREGAVIGILKKAEYSVVKTFLCSSTSFVKVNLECVSIALESDLLNLPHNGIF
jgi:hypothetical protein